MTSSDDMLYCYLLDIISHLQPLSHRCQLSFKFSDFFDFNTSTTRGHPYKLYVSRATANVRRHFLLTVWLNRGTACLWMLLISAHLIAFVARCTESTLTLSLWWNDNLTACVSL